MTLQCPWSFLDFPATRFCESPLCEWVAEPANAYSSLAYLLVGIMLLPKTKQRGGGNSLVLAGLCAILGLGSFFRHASSTVQGLWVDLFAMEFLSAFIFLMAVRQFKPLNRSWSVAVYAIAFFAPLAVTHYERTWGTTAFGLQIASAFFLEVYCNRKSVPVINIAVSLGAFFLALVVWILDTKRVWCSPNNHWINGHSLWHVLTAVSILYLGRFYALRDSAQALSNNGG